MHGKNDTNSDVGSDIDELTNANEKDPFFSTKNETGSSSAEFSPLVSSPPAPALQSGEQPGDTFSQQPGQKLRDEWQRFSIWILNCAWPWTRENYRDVIFWSLFAFFSIFTVLPLWILNYLPLGDLPDHAGQIQVILNQEKYVDEYRINWFTPYLLAYGLTLFLSPFFSIITSIKIVLSVTTLAFPFAAYLLNRQLGGNRYWSLICFPAAFSFAFYWGFYSFVVATTISIYFLVFVLAYARQNITRTWYACAFAFSLLLFFAHLLVWGFAVSVAPLIIFMFNNLKETARKSLAFFLIFPLAAYWMSVSGETTFSTAAPLREGYYLSGLFERATNEYNYIVEMFNQRTEKNEHVMRVKELMGYAIGRAALPDYIFLACCLLIWPLFCGARLTLNYRRWLPLLYCITLFMLVPYWIFEVAYVYYRFAVFLLPLALFVYVKRQQQDEAEKIDWYRITRYTVGIFIIAFLLQGNYKAFASFSEDDANFSRIINVMQPDKVVQTLIFNDESGFNYSPAYMHFGVWYQAVKGGVVTFSFSHDPLAYGVPVRYKDKPREQPDPWNPSEFSWHRHEGHLYDYFLIRSKVQKDYLFIASNDIVLLDQQGMWYLYGRKSLTPAEPDSGLSDSVEQENVEKEKTIQ